MVPNIGFNLAMLVIWGIILAVNCVQVYWRQWWFSIAFICADILEILGYVGRVIGHYNLYSLDPYILQMVCLTLAPIFTMGGLYYQLAKLIEIYGHKYSLLPSPMAYSYIFIFCDIVSLAVQAAGGGVAATDVADSKSSHQGTQIFIGGLSLQVATMVIFMVLWFYFTWIVYIDTRLKYTGKKFPTWSVLKVPNIQLEQYYREKYAHLRVNPERFLFKYFPLAFSAAVIFVFIRCCYRLAELVDGWSGYIITHENYFIILDALMVSMATVLMSIFHPGLAFDGLHTSIPITKGHVDPETLMNVDLESSAYKYDEDIQVQSGCNDGDVDIQTIHTQTVGKYNDFDKRDELEVVDEVNSFKSSSNGTLDTEVEHQIDDDKEEKVDLKPSTSIEYAV
ncbi:hypothetical protein TBLA_0A09460 [Henningerozyma blattae CBS 6284]|uniref:Sphingoid long-chain base transporter RSB1 n=1 Tax=Henningerozyma blattae (strain ATCC 34711 / CBS 6284 / DSM 70876 / NBRC 10599 / NRRL Y-10934 / UCD 77-7) TaxID=1071380 RepID=I2GX79_HENB6|nr:hypothetical protein TBLA_0A09460 [Tetrapisispora blattae CBS 6284]CCH58731.1 hypothetical protein TBLA_0A09460 [Tetrapisispora blattae CBS 6284]